MKRILIILLSISLIMAFFGGCGKKEEPKPTTEMTEPTTTTTDSTMGETIIDEAVDSLEAMGEDVKKEAEKVVDDATESVKGAVEGH
ncbi:MAG: hypothetical protein ABIJ45_03615 [Candidatus Zixiibacteriota bacterium]